ncbi:MAG: hypothetical protein K8T90_12290 [Planctomycetes bacterium]|nr:hypothetical protein [Planctomycetota bacterium]
MHRFRNAVMLAAILALSGGLVACAAPGSGPSGKAATRRLGESFPTTVGDVYLIRVQDEYRLIRCMPDTAIQGCYEDVFRMQRDALTDDSAAQHSFRWNQWVNVPSVPGLEIMFLSPEQVALRQIAAAPIR